MSLFDRLVEAAMRNRQNVVPLKIVVEKELLHHDILREMGEAGLLASLTFIGGTCLRMCYGSNRLSEDLDFTGGANFNHAALAKLGSVMEERLNAKYDLDVKVTPPQKESGNTVTWKLTVQTRPGHSDVPLQRINIDICAIPSYQRRPLMLRNHYGVDMGTSGLIVQAESREEILADKLVALALRPNRIKNRDLWDMTWLHQQGIDLPMELLPLKLKDHRCETPRFLTLLHERHMSLGNPEVRKSFIREIRRFLPAPLVEETVEQPEFWAYLTQVVAEHCQKAGDFLLNESEISGFKM